MFFPVFIPVQNRPILLVGAGPVALGKAQKLLPFKPQLRVIARQALPQFNDWAAQGHLTLELREFRFEDLSGIEMVIMAVDDLELQRQVFEYCQAQRILCNCVDVPEYCSWIFPALVQRKNLVIAISTGGKAPFLASTLRQWIEQTLPVEFDEIIHQVESFRRSAEVAQLKTAAERGQKVIEFAKKLLTGIKLQPKSFGPQENSSSEVSPPSVPAPE